MTSALQFLMGKRSAVIFLKDELQLAGVEVATNDVPPGHVPTAGEISLLAGV